MGSREAAAVITFIVCMTAVPAFSATRSRPVWRGYAEEALAANVLTIENELLTTYAGVDFGPVFQSKIVDGRDDVANSNYAVIPLVQASAYVVKYEREGNLPANADRALALFELAADLHPYWGTRWASAPVVNFLALGVQRLRAEGGLSPAQRSRVELDWQRAREILRVEADAALGCIDVPYAGCESLPFAPLDSSTTGDSKAEEDAWEASLLTAAAVFYPEHPNAGLWSKKALELAYDAITRPSDPAYPDGVKTATVSEQFDVDNHGFLQNAYYAAATLQLLQQAALPYRITGRPVPPELLHNFDALYARYRTYVSYDASGMPYWNVSCDSGDPSIFPLAMTGDVTAEYLHAAIKARSGFLWTPVSSVDLSDGNDLWAAIQNHKVGWYYLVGSYYWHWPAPPAEGPPDAGTIAKRLE